MASKVLAQIPPVDINLKRTFENAVRDIYLSGLNGKAPSYRRPIVQRPAVAPQSSATAQKKALSDAAKALAQLWKVSTNSSR
ncbi:MAG TPA: hypothetical protein VMU05_05705 [Dongiaceae bacterium]|nr:hypothetical protein [Dongiaceae bacterium]